MNDAPSFRNWRYAAGALCVIIASGAASAPKKETSSTIDSIRAKPTTSTRKPAPAPKKSPVIRKSNPRPVTKAPTPKAPTTVAKPAPSVPTLYVSPGGKDPYTSIATALTKAPVGARVLVRTGIYTECLQLSKPVEIVPATPTDAVVIESPRGPAVLMRTDKATLRQITLRQIPGAGVGDYTVEAPQGHLILDGCTVQSGDKSAVGAHGSGTTIDLRKCELRGTSKGLIVFGRAKATLEDCVLVENSEFGAQAETGGELTARACRFGRNGKDGISVHSSTVVVDDCDFSGNKRHGIWVWAGRIQATNCRVYDSGLDGIWLDEKSSGGLDGCESYRSGRTGIVLHRQTDVRFSRSKAYENKQQGLVVASRAASRFENCEFTGNTTVGMIVMEQSTPTFRNCRIASAASDAVHITTGGRGTFEDCVVAKSGGSAGIALHTQANPVFRRTKVSGGWWGAYFDAAQGEFEDCDFVDTAGPTIYVLNKSSAKFTGCRVRGSKERGMVFATGSTGTVARCEITGSGGAGVAIKDAASPTFTECTIAGGKAQGLHVEVNGKGTFLDCTIAKNAGAGAGIHSGGATVLKHCRIEENGMGVQVSHDGAGVLDGCLIVGNAGHGVEIVVNGNPLVKGCTIRQNRGHGIVVSGTGRGTIESPVLEQNASGNLQVPSGSKAVVRGVSGI